MIRTLCRTGCAVAVVAASPAKSQETQEAQSLAPVVVTGRSANLLGVADSATEGTITAKQLATRPLLRAAEVLESVPGMTVTQHSGDGKANQYFLRGFNLDHGSDFANYVNGMPINEVSHAHGQGYTDLNFLIPELVGTVDYRKGTYGAEDGDFATTGSARINYVRSLPAPFADLTLGEHSYRRFLSAGSGKLGDQLTVLAAFEAGTTDGPWEQPEGLHKVNGVLRLSSGTAGNGFSLTGMAYRSRWIGTEEVPERAIASGEIGRYGTLAPTDGGKTYRYSASGDWARTDAQGASRASAYVIRYGLNLFSTPSGLQDSQHEQEDRRTTWGGMLSHRWELGPSWRDTEATVGLQFRQDRMPRLGLFQTVDRVRTETVREDRAVETAVGAYAEARTHWSAWFRSTLGLRYDQLRATVSPIGGAFNTENGGTARGSQASPKLSLVFGPFSNTEFYANWGRGFHSNDFRGATLTVNPLDGSSLQPVPALAKATSAEIGLRARPLPGWNTALSFWQTKLASELVFVGDEGVTEPRGASRRQGIEWWNDYTPNGWLIVDADLAISQARFVQASNGGTHVPNAIPLSSSLGISADPGGAWFGGLRLRYIGAYPLEEIGEHKSTPFLTANLKVGYRFGPKLRATIDVLNLFDRKANDIEYWGTSCTRAEGASCNNGDGVEGRLVHPMEPRTVRVSLRANF
jgi:outer membrane receptor protein involved in Fe transport